MLKKLSVPKKEDSCPNCGTACFATEVLCPNCGKNLDELFERLPGLEESKNIFRATSKRLPFLTWLTPLTVMLSSFIVSLVTALPFALHVRTFPDRSPLQLIWYAVPRSTLVSSGLLLMSAIPLFLCTTRLVRAKLGQRFAVILAAVFSILSVIALWSELQAANIMSATYSFAYFGGSVFLRSADWVNFVSAVGTVLVVLNLMTVIGQEKTA